MNANRILCDDFKPAPLSVRAMPNHFDFSQKALKSHMLENSSPVLHPPSSTSQSPTKPAQASKLSQ